MFIDDLRKSILQKAMNWELIEWSDYNSRKENKMEDCCSKIETWNSISENVKKTKYSNLNTWYNFIATKDLEFEHSFQYENWIKIPYDEPNFKYANIDDILLCIEWWSAWRKIWILSQKVCYWNKLCKFSVEEFINPRFLYYFLQSPDFQKLFRENINGLIGWVSIGKIRKLVLKYPPLEEQKRIVAKLDELMPLLEEARPLEEEIMNLEKEFPNKLHQAILQYAIQWKLVEQDSKEEPASELLKKMGEQKEKLIKEKKIKKEKPLAPIVDEEKPFDIPGNWEWVKLWNIVSIIRWLTFPKTAAKEENGDNLSLVLRWWNIDSKTEKLIFNDNIYVDNSYIKEEQYIKKWDTLIVASSGTKTSVWKSCFINSDIEKTSFWWFMMVLRPKKYINPKYIAVNIKLYRQKIISLTAWYISNITLPILNNLLIPLPPLEEQKRIATKLDELLELCDDLEGAVNLS